MSWWSNFRLFARGDSCELTEEDAARCRAESETSGVGKIRVRLHLGARTLGYGEVVRLWGRSASFRALFVSTLKELPYAAYFWETPPVTERTFDRDFEFVVTESRELATLQPDPRAFETHWSGTNEPTAVFHNLGGDAVLIAPRPLANATCYTHLARFVRTAPMAQVDAFWQTTALAVEKSLSDQPMWLSTAGLGVSWLHLRLDSRPKYYRHAEYKIA